MDNITTTDLTPPMEDYLETIGEVCRENGVARVKDIAVRMEVKYPSVVRALSTLKRKRLVHQEHYGFVRLTEQGEQIAHSILRRHEVLADFLQNVLGLDAETAAQDACKIEHAVSAETVERLRNAAVFLQSEAHADLNWRKEFDAFRAQRGRKRAT